MIVKCGDDLRQELLAYQLLLQFQVCCTPLSLVMPAWNYFSIVYYLLLEFLLMMQAKVSTPFPRPNL